MRLSHLEINRLRLKPETRQSVGKIGGETLEFRR
jgi:hypothetical protein